MTVVLGEAEGQVKVPNVTGRTYAEAKEAEALRGEMPDVFKEFSF